MSHINVLDHGFVRLVDHMGSDLSVVRAARQSFDEGWRAGENESSDIRLINYLWRHKHSVPFEAVVFQFQVKAPIFVFRQWQRHRTWPFWSINEVSARYRELPEEYYVPDLKIIGAQSVKNKQGRSYTTDPQLREHHLDLYKSSCKNAFIQYHILLQEGWPRELARCVLPLATYTTLSGKVDLWNLFNFLTLRNDEHAQYEIRVYAITLLKLIEPIVPVCVAAWQNGETQSLV